MKFIPRKYRESQSEWFGKRGLSWHITECTVKPGSQLQSITYVHILEQCSQDNATVLAIMQHVLTQLHSSHPDITVVVYRYVAYTVSFVFTLRLVTCRNYMYMTSHQ